MPRPTFNVIVEKAIGLKTKLVDAVGAAWGTLTNPIHVSAVLSGSSVTIGDATAAKQDAQTALLTTIDADTSKIPTDPAKESGKLTTIDSTLTAMNAKLVTGTDIGDVTINNATGAAAVNIQDGGNAITVDAVNLDIRDLAYTQDNVKIMDASGNDLDFPKENDNWNAADHGILIFGRDVESSPNKYRSIRLDTDGRAEVHVDNTAHEFFEHKNMDFDSGAGTDNRSAIGILLPASGGGVIGGTDTNPLTTSVKTMKPDGTNTMPSLDVAGRAGFVQITDGVDTETLHTENVAIGTSIGPVLLTRSTGGAAVSPVVGTALVDGASGNYSGFFVNSRNEGWDGAAWDLFRVADLCTDVQGASPQTLIAATASKKHRIHSITLSADTTGLITISDGIGRFYWTAGNPPISIVFANNGKLQTTANTAITVTNSGGGNVACGCCYNNE